MPFDSSFQVLHTALDDLCERRISTASFCQVWRAETGLLDALPGRYREVMEDLLGRMEAGSLFTEESCSFSQEELREHLAIWLNKAARTLTNKA